MCTASKSLPFARVDDETVYFDFNDVLDILPSETQKHHYTVVFYDGEIWKEAKMYKRFVDKFTNIKRKRGQTDNEM